MTDTGENRDSDANHTRRRFLQAVAAGTVVGGVGLATAQDADFRLGGEVGGWMGRSPDAI